MKQGKIGSFIYNSRNFNRSLDNRDPHRSAMIYNSRNFNRSLDQRFTNYGGRIYNSRNFNRSLDFPGDNGADPDLQQ